MLELPEDSHTGRAGRELVPRMVCSSGSWAYLHRFPALVAHLKVGDKEVCTKEFIAALVIIRKLETI